MDRQSIARLLVVDDEPNVQYSLEKRLQSDWLQVVTASTARDGMMIDLRVVVLSDATATLSDIEQQASLNILIQEFADILTVADRLWFDHVIAHRPPPPSGNPEALIDLFDELHPERTGIAHLDRDLVAFEALQEYMEASLVEKTATDRKKAAKAVLVNALGDNDTAVLGEDVAFTYKKTAGRESVNTARLAEHFPEAFDACVSTGDGSPRFDISHKFRKTWRSSE